MRAISTRRGRADVSRLSSRSSAVFHCTAAAYSSGSALSAGECLQSMAALDGSVASFRLSTPSDRSPSLARGDRCVECCIRHRMDVICDPELTQAIRVRVSLALSGVMRKSRHQPRVPRWSVSTVEFPPIALAGVGRGACSVQPVQHRQVLVAELEVEHLSVLLDRLPVGRTSAARSYRLDRTNAKHRAGERPKRRATR